MFSTKNEQQGETNILRQKREEFRAEIRKRNNEDVFRQKRNQLTPSINVQLDAATVLAEFDQMNPKRFEKVFELSSSDKKEDLLALLKHDIVKQACLNFREDTMESIFGALANLSTLEEFKQMDSNLIMLSLNAGLDYLSKANRNSRAVDNVLVYCGNLCDKSEQLSTMHSSKETLQVLVKLAHQSLSLPSTLSNIYYLLLTCYNNANKSLIMLEQKILIFKIIGLGIGHPKMYRELQFELLTVLSHIVSSDILTVDLVLKVDAPKFLLNCLDEGGEHMMIALRIVTRITMCEDPRPTDVLLQLNLLDKLDLLLASRVLQVRKQAYAALSNICYTNQEIVQRVLTHRIIERITKVFVLDRIEDEACAMTCLANLLAVANVEQYERLFAMNVVQSMVSSLQSDHTDLIIATLGCIGLLCNYGRELQIQKQLDKNPVVRNLRVLNVTVHLERLQKFKLTSVYQAVDKLLMDYFDYNMSQS